VVGEDLVQLQLRRNVDAAVQNLLESLQKLAGRGGFQQKSAHTAAQRLHHGLAVPAHGEHHDFGGNIGFADLAYNLHGQQIREI
jgi:hypothetical protein